MKILLDIGHPAHYHLFKNFIKIMRKNGHIFCIIARDKEVTKDLLEANGDQFINRGKGYKGIIGTNKKGN